MACKRVERRSQPYCVFKALFGSEENKALLIDFLNSVLRPAVLIVDVTLLNPTNDKPRLDAKETSIEVKARDASGAVFQVDVQLVVLNTLPHRMLFNWATLYSRELSEGEGYEVLRPVTSIWVLRRNLWESEGHHHRFEAIERDTNLVLSPHFSVHTLELAKWTALAESSSGPAPTPEDVWMGFLRDARTWQTLPEPLTALPQMRHAMTVLKKFSDDELAYDNYLSRLDREREQRGLENYAKNMTAARDEAVAALDAALAQLRQAEAHAAQAETHAAQAETHAAQAIAQAEAHAAQAVAQAVAQAEANLREAQHQQMRQTLQTLYAARFGVAPAAVIEALEAAPLEILTAWLPLFASATASEIQTLEDKLMATKAFDFVCDPANS